jgi:hypothetical protein
MSTRIATITAEVRISSDESYSETLSEVMGEIEEGIQRTGLTYRVWVGSAEAEPAGTEADR